MQALKNGHLLSYKHIYSGSWKIHCLNWNHLKPILKPVSTVQS